MKVAKIYIVMVREFGGWTVCVATDKAAFAQSKFIDLPRNTRIATGAIVKFKAGRGMVQGLFGPEADANSAREERISNRQSGKIFPSAVPKDPEYEAFKSEVVRAARTFLRASKNPAHFSFR